MLPRSGIPEDRAWPRICRRAGPEAVNTPAQEPRVGVIRVDSNFFTGELFCADAIALLVIVIRVGINAFKHFALDFKLFNLHRAEELTLLLQPGN